MTTIDQADLEELVRRDQMAAVAKAQLVGMPVNSFLALIVALLLDGSYPTAGILTWLVSVFVLNACRYGVMSLFAKGKLSYDRRNMLLFSNCGSIISGSLWSMLSLMYVNADTVITSMVMFIIAGITAGATVLAPAYAWSSIIYVSPVLLSTTFVTMMHGGSQNIIFSVVTILFLTMLIRSSFESQAAFREACLLKHQAISANAELYHLANHDPLTQLLNRGAFVPQIQHKLSDANGGAFSLLLVDLDHFKSINDTLGHKAGDTVLVEIASRIRGVLGPDHAAFRIGGDEFALLLPSDHTIDTDSASARELIAATIMPFVVQGQEVNVGVSIGIARFPDDGTTSDDLLLCADLALYAAKSAGRQCFRRFDSTLLKSAEIARDIEHDLRRAIGDGSLEVWFQPQVELAQLRLVGLEALIRWCHPRHGWIAPPLIVAAALRTHASEALTGFVLSQACAKIRQLADADEGHVVVAVNISPSEIRQYALPRLIQTTIDTHGIDPAQLELEITEEALIGGESVLAELDALSALGVRLAIDDFGAGCASLAYLRTLRVDRIKIDRCFVTGFADRERDRILVQAILGIGRSFRLDVIAEGVETAEEALLLRGFGCRAAQGYYFGKPMSPESLRAWTDAQDPSRSASNDVSSAGGSMSGPREKHA